MLGRWGVKTVAISQDNPGDVEWFEVHWFNLCISPERNLPGADDLYIKQY
jgi:hypothetical protein